MSCELRGYLDNYLLARYAPTEIVVEQMAPQAANVELPAVIGDLLDYYAWWNDDTEFKPPGHQHRVAANLIVVDHDLDARDPQVQSVIEGTRILSVAIANREDPSCLNLALLHVQAINSATITPEMLADVGRADINPMHRDEDRSKTIDENIKRATAIIALAEFLLEPEY